MELLIRRITFVTEGVDLLLYLTYRRIANPSIQALAQDHRNDFASNVVALAGGFIGKASHHCTT